MKIVNETPRKIIRYLLFARKNGVKLAKPIISKKGDKAIVRYFEKKKEFTSWDDFEIKWDIGIGDDPILRINRPEKWFLFGEPKTEIILRPDDYWEKESTRRKISSHALYQHEASQRGLTLAQFFELFFG